MIRKLTATDNDVATTVLRLALGVIFFAHDGKVVTSGEITDEVLAQLRAGKLAVRQKPGPANALGLIKLIFPNEYNVYLHSTPSQDLFSRSRRDFSHGPEETIAKLSADLRISADSARIVVGSTGHESRPEHSQQSTRAARAALRLWGLRQTYVFAIRFRGFSGHQGRLR